MDRTSPDSPSFNEHSGVLSPDDRLLAYVSDESGRDEVRLVLDWESERQRLVPHP